MCLGTLHMPLHVHGKRARKVNAAYNVILAKYTLGFLGLSWVSMPLHGIPAFAQVILGFSISHNSINPWPASIHLRHACILILIPDWYQLCNTRSCIWHVRYHSSRVGGMYLNNLEMELYTYFMLLWNIIERDFNELKPKHLVLQQEHTLT